MIDKGWLLSAKLFYSAHHNPRPVEDDISLLVIHNISLPPAQFGGEYIEDFFCGRLDTTVDPYFETIKSLRVSAHCLIKRTGEVLQFVPFSESAWHAGVSCFDGRESCNDFSIGIELEGTDDISYTNAQYNRLIEVTNIIMQFYPQINPQRIVGHSDIAAGRKTDPGESFDWERYRQALV